jgi:hypothetical protein
MSCKKGFAASQSSIGVAPGADTWASRRISSGWQATSVAQPKPKYALSQAASCGRAERSARASAR